MTRTIGYCALMVSFLIVVVLAATFPFVLGDSNPFLKNFVNHEFLNVLGVILAITLASSANLHLELNKLEEHFKRKGGMGRTRAEVSRASFALIWLFVFAVFIVVTKPLIGVYEWVQAVCNGAAIIVLLWYVLILITITQTVFRIPPLVEND